MKRFITILFLFFCLLIFNNQLYAQQESEDSTKREMISFPQPLNTTNSVGIVVIKISVDKEGNVVSTQFVPEKSTTTNMELIENAKNAALKAKFTKNEKAPPIEIGHITYKFELR